MSMFNSPRGYGTATKAFHWLIAALFALQYSSANIMTRIAHDEAALGLSQGTYYNWHKSLGLVALAIAVARIVNRHIGSLPAWAPGLSAGERRFAHRSEWVLYAAMLAMPVSGYVYVMAGGYGVMLFGVWKLDDPIGKWETLASVARAVHIAGGWLLLAGILGHVGLVLRHQLWLGDRLLARMLPGRGV